MRRGEETGSGKRVRGKFSGAVKALAGFFRKRPGEQRVVFTGDRVEAEMVLRFLKEEGFHPYEWADLPGPYVGPAGTARVVVPPEEEEAASAFLASLAGEEGNRGETEDPRGKDR